MQTVGFSFHVLVLMQRNVWGEDRRPAMGALFS